MEFILVIKYYTKNYGSDFIFGRSNRRKKRSIDYIQESSSFKLEIGAKGQRDCMVLVSKELCSIKMRNVNCT